MSVLCARMREELTSVARMSLPERPPHNVTPQSKPPAGHAATPTCQAPSPATALTPMDTGDSAEQRARTLQDNASTFPPSDLGTLSTPSGNLVTAVSRSTPDQLAQTPACTPMDTGTTAAASVPPTASPLPAVAPPVSSATEQPADVAPGNARLSSAQPTPPTAALESALTPMDTGETVPALTPPTVRLSPYAASAELAAQGSEPKQGPSVTVAEPHFPERLIPEAVDSGKAEVSPGELRVPDPVADGRITPPELGGCAPNHVGTPEALGGGKWSHGAPNTDGNALPRMAPANEPMGMCVDGMEPNACRSGKSQPSGNAGGVSFGNAVSASKGNGDVPGVFHSNLSSEVGLDDKEGKITPEAGHEGACDGLTCSAGLHSPLSAQTARTSLGMVPIPTPWYTLQTAGGQCELKRTAPSMEGVQVLGAICFYSHCPPAVRKSS
jgi:hypothetical protein